MKNGNSSQRGANKRRGRSGGAGNSKIGTRNSGKQPVKQANREDYLAECRRRVERGEEKARRDTKRIQWTAPSLPVDPIPHPICNICNNVIKIPAEAVTDKNSGGVAHFDCVREYIVAQEILEPGDKVSYIGGGRFGILNFEDGNQKTFKIKKIIEWESQENRAPWRSDIADRFSAT